jgi:hypothetical protein
VLFVVVESSSSMMMMLVEFPVKECLLIFVATEESCFREESCVDSCGCGECGGDCDDEGMLADDCRRESCGGCEESACGDHC